MAVTLIGEIVNSCDGTGGFSTGNISGDDDFVEGSGAIGVKASNTTIDIFTTSLGAGAPYDFSSGGVEEGYHCIMWFNTKTPVATTTGLGIYMGNGTNFGVWDVLGTGFYKGGFVTRIINPAADFDTVSGWSATGNPAQLSAVSEVGGRFVTTTSIMGSFNNVQLDQMTVGLGLRVDAGTVGTPNNFETARAADEDAAFYGFWSSSNGTIIGKGGIFIGVATGSATSVFNSSNEKVAFADERVATGFYEINTRGSGTDVTWDLINISSANSTNARWTLTIQSDTNSFSDTNGIWSGSDALVLNANSTLTNTTIIDGNSITQNSATISGVTIINPNTASNTAYITANSLADITGLDVTNSAGTGHLIDLGTVSTSTSVDWDVTYDSGSYDAGTSGSPITTTTTGDEAILVNVASGQTLTINVASGATVPSVKNDGAGDVNVVAGAVSITITAVETDGTPVGSARVFVETNTGTGSLPYQDSVSITRSGSTATVTHTAHGLSTGDKVVIRGANEREYVGIWTISNVTTNTYDFTVSGTPATPATGTIVSSFVFISDVTNGSGVVSSPSRTLSTDQAIKGNVRKSSSSPYYKTGSVVGTATTADGLSTTVVMLRDE